ncbi:uncharacterized protein MONBRDRAFT_22004 [Monosiga brevicollis MX1]|uniref:Rho-GAP domain-containing protein n=1 Tax=Monosiga brevicollis TaxID=81824 RepID=A9UP92_MONBE|nr:uncharacterized protein MONBRDRAFT_22004 [Monosiga brevicollis MX1]EDQ92833.1 predicted protein [Monosiga brevicollis MX1]|eukprot:XP_001742595.1 hypothetical protein [Monosiga brevicollis MX1]
MDAVATQTVTHHMPDDKGNGSLMLWSRPRANKMDLLPGHVQLPSGAYLSESGDLDPNLPRLRLAEVEQDMTHALEGLVQQGFQDADWIDAFVQENRPSAPTRGGLSLAHEMLSQILASDEPIDLMGTSGALRKLLTMPLSDRFASVLVHRIGNTLLIDDAAPLLENNHSSADIGSTSPDPASSSQTDSTPPKPGNASSSAAQGFAQLLRRLLTQQSHAPPKAGSGPQALTHEPQPNLNTCSDEALRHFFERLLHASAQLLDSRSPPNSRPALPPSYAQAVTKGPANSTGELLHAAQILGAFDPAAARDAFVWQHRSQRWTFSNLRAMVESDLTIFGDQQHPAISLQFRPDSQPINVLTGVDLWLDNLMCNVPEVLMCYYVEGVVKSFETLRSSDLPERFEFDPNTVCDLSNSIVRFLQDQCTHEGHTYWLMRDSGEEVVRLFDLTSLLESQRLHSNDDYNDLANPYAHSVALLLYRIASRMLQASEPDFDGATVRRLLLNASRLLDSQRFPHLAATIHFLLTGVDAAERGGKTPPGGASKHKTSPRKNTEQHSKPSKTVKGGPRSTDSNGLSGTPSAGHAQHAPTHKSSGTGRKRTGFDEPAAASHHSQGGEPDDRPASGRDGPTPLPADVHQQLDMSLSYLAEGLSFLATRRSDSSCAQLFPAMLSRAATLFYRRGVLFQQRAALGEALRSCLFALACSTTVKHLVATEATRARSSPSTDTGSSGSKDVKSAGGGPKATLDPTSLQVALPGRVGLVLYCESDVRSDVLRLLGDVLVQAASEGSASRSALAACLGEVPADEARILLSCDPGVDNVDGDAVDSWVATWRAACSAPTHVVLPLRIDLALDWPLPTAPVALTEMAVSVYNQLINEVQPGDDRLSAQRRQANALNVAGSVLISAMSEQLQAQDEGSTATAASVAHGTWDSMWKQSYSLLLRSAQQFEACGDVINLALVLCNLAKLNRLAYAWLTLGDDHAEGTRTKQRHHHDRAVQEYERARAVLGTRATHPEIYDMVQMELASASLAFATLLQDDDTRDRGTQFETDVDDLLQKARKLFYHELQTLQQSPQVEDEQFCARRLRALAKLADVHNRLGLLHGRAVSEGRDNERNNAYQLMVKHLSQAREYYLLSTMPLGVALQLHWVVATAAVRVQPCAWRDGLGALLALIEVLEQMVQDPQAASELGNGPEALANAMCDLLRSAIQQVGRGKGKHSEGLKAAYRCSFDPPVGSLSLSLSLSLRSLRVADKSLSLKYIAARLDIFNSGQRSIRFAKAIFEALPGAVLDKTPDPARQGLAEFVLLFVKTRPSPTAYRFFALIADSMAEEQKKRPFRPATISSGTPLRHRDQLIDKATRERFEQLDLETLLAEFKRVAAEESQRSFEEAPPTEDDVIEEQKEWLNSTGFETLAQQFQGGKAITEDDVQLATAGFTASQRRAVVNRAKALNSTLTKRGQKLRPSAQSVFGESTAAQDASDTEIGRFIERAQSSPTHFDDLSADDQAQLKRLTLIEATALFENKGVPSSLLSKRKRKRAKATGHVFGGTITTMVEHDVRNHPAAMASNRVPIFFQRAIAFLQQFCEYPCHDTTTCVGRPQAQATPADPMLFRLTPRILTCPPHGDQITGAVDEEGLFRKAGSAARIKKLREAIEKSWGDVNLEAMDCRPHDVAAALKQFLRETSDPLLTDELIESFSETQKLGDDQLYGLQLLVMLLPKEHSDCLQQLLGFLHEVAQSAGVNKMNIANLAVVFAPTLFFIRGSKGQQMLKEVELQVTTASTLKLMVERYQELWQVPAKLMAQMRYVNESRRAGLKTSNAKELKRLLSDKKLMVPAKPASGHDGTVLWVADSKAVPPVRAITTVIANTGEAFPNVQICDDTTTADLLKATHAPPGCFLYETGGNLNRRRLQPQQLILPVLKVNPSASLMSMS